MNRKLRWDPCIAHHGNEVDQFIPDYFSASDRYILFIAGAGFDPRSTAIASRFATACTNIQGVFIRENRPNPAGGLVERANGNSEALTKSFTDHRIIHVDIFGADGAVIGGRNVIKKLSDQNLEGITDVVVDISALSVGTSFPIIRYLYDNPKNENTNFNLHVFVAHNPELDTNIKPIPSDKPGFVHGFRGGATLDESSRSAKLWLPQLVQGRVGALNRLHQFVDPHDTCPILPFPSHNPRLGDTLAEEYLVEFESSWAVDTRNIVYADEGDPLDLYRTILRLDDLRKPVFQEVGGSLLVLSPLGSKVMALGALMAALERNLPVAYLESIGYDFEDAMSETVSSPNLFHIWLDGDVYKLS